MSRLLAAIAVLLTLTLACAAPAAAEDGSVDLTITVSLDRTAYLPGEQVTIDLTVMNNGPAAATGVVVRAHGDLDFGPWGDLDQTGPGTTLAPGEQRTITLTAEATDETRDLKEQFELVSNEKDLDPTYDKASVDVFLTAKHADLELTISGDADRDGVVDPGEPRAGVLVSLWGGLESGDDLTARTDEAGVAHFPGIPGGEYHANVQLPKGWYTDPNQTIRVRAGANTAVVQAALVDLTALSASMSLDRDSYAPGDTVRERVTLTNSGATDIVGVVALCGLYGAENSLSSNDWGELSTLNEGGATIPAGTTRTWEFTGVVPLLSYDYGYVWLRCAFAPPGGMDGPVAETRAAVPGGRGTFAGTFVTEQKEPLAGIKVLLLDMVNGATVARAVSDASGRFEFPDLPANQYELRLVGPWRQHESVYSVQIWAGQRTEYPITLFPGPVQADPDAPPVGKSTVAVVPAPAPGPAPQASPRPTNLASTGADVINLAALGFLLVLVGAGLLFIRRRTVS